MSWAKIDDLLPHHDKLIRAGSRADSIFGVYVASICYSQRHLSDGEIPRQALSLLLPGLPRPSKRVIADLVALKLWEETEAGWRVHDYLVYNKPAATVRAERQAESERKKRGRPGGIRPDIQAASGHSDTATASATATAPTQLPSHAATAAASASASAPMGASKPKQDGFSANRPDTAKTAATRYPTTEAEYLASRGGVA